MPTNITGVPPGCFKGACLPQGLDGGTRTLASIPKSEWHDRKSRLVYGKIYSRRVRDNLAAGIVCSGCVRWLAE